MERKLVKYILICLCLMSNVILFAQPGDTDGTPTDNLEGTDPPATIDSMLLLIGLFAIVFGFYLLRHSITKTERLALKEN